MFIPANKDDHILPMIDMISGENNIISNWKDKKSRGLNTINKEKKIKTRGVDRKKLDRYKSHVDDDNAPD